MDSLFVRVIGESALAFPGYDGNGMFLSMGNASRHGGQRNVSTMLMN